MLTPEEFVAAGEHLVHHCPTWQWASGDETKIKSYLPKNKQFLITRNVPCSRRCKQMEYSHEQERIIESDGVDDGWVDTHHYDMTSSGLEDKVQEMTLDSEKTDKINDEQNNEDDNDEDDDDNEEAADMEEFEESGMLDDQAAVDNSIKIKKTNTEATIEGEIVHTRTYDLHITYDKYYQTPRLWIYGYNEVS